MNIGIDIGGSTTKIVGFIDGRIIDPLSVEASDPIASASGALGKFLTVNNLSLADIKSVKITGVGASFLGNSLLGLQLTKVEEFKALGYGGLFLSKLNKAVVVSMGTGTAFVKATPDGIFHLGGTGVGGGTILGLSKAMVHLSNFETIIETARSGKPDHVDLSISDISRIEIGNLPGHLTASNFGKMNDQATKNDVTLGILTMVFQVIGMLAIFAARAENYQDIVLTGKLVHVFRAEKTFSELAELYKLQFHVPIHAEYCTAIGAAIS